MGDDQATARDEHACRLGCSAGPLEPMPALADGDEVHGRVGVGKRLGAPGAVGNRQAGGAVERCRLGEQRRGRIDARDAQPAGGESARHGARAGAEVERAHAGGDPAPRLQRLEECQREAGTKGPVVARGATEIDL